MNLLTDDFVCVDDDVICVMELMMMTYDRNV